MAALTMSMVDDDGVARFSSVMLEYCCSSGRKWLESTNTPTMLAADCCLRSFSAQRAAKLAMWVRRVSKSCTMPSKLRLVQMLFLRAGRSSGMQSVPLSSAHVRSTTMVRNVECIHVAEWLAKSWAVLMPMLLRRAA